MRIKKFKLKLKSHPASDYHHIALQQSITFLLFYLTVELSIAILLLT